MDDGNPTMRPLHVDLQNDSQKELTNDPIDCTNALRHFAGL